MHKEQVLLILSIIFIIILFLTSEFQAPIIIGELEKISGSNPIRIHLKNQTTEIIIFSKNVNIEPNSKIEIYGTKQGETIIAHKIICSNC